MTSEEKTLQLSPDDIAKLLRENADLQVQVTAIKSQLESFKHQLFGRKSEKLTEIDTTVIDDMFAGSEQLKITETESEKSKNVTVPEHTRKKKNTNGTPEDSGLHFGPDVPAQEIELPCWTLEADPEGYQVIGTKATYRLPSVQSRTSL